MRRDSKDQGAESIQLAGGISDLLSNGSVKERMSIARSGVLSVTLQHDLAIDTKTSVRAELASNAALDASTLAMLISDTSWRVRLLACEHPNCGPSALESAVLYDSHWEIRLRAIYHANADRDLWLKAQEDSNRRVRAAATNCISKIDLANPDNQWPRSLKEQQLADMPPRPMVIDPLWYWFYQDYIPPEHHQGPTPVVEPVVESVVRWVAPSAIAAPVGLIPWNV